MLKYYLYFFACLNVCIAISQETTTITSGNWNESSIWSNGIPDQTQTAIIGKNTIVTITEDHIARNVVVHGTLNVTENGATSKSLSANWVHVNSGGVFQIGTAQDRFDQSKFTLNLTGTDPNADQTVPMANGMTMDIKSNNGFLMAAGGGRLQFFGAEKLSFTKLSQTANAGDNTITVENIIDRNFDNVFSANTDGEVNWEVGDEIVIASSSTTYTDEDVRTITAVQNLGATTRFTLDRPLDFKHYGEIETYGQNLDPLSIPIKGGPRSIDLRAEVALLSRNVMVRGTETQDTDTFLGNRNRLQLQSDGKAANGVGGHVMIMPTAGQITVDGIQLDLMGQAGRLGRYPFHWHIARDRNGDVFKNSSITNSNNRAVVVHTTDNVLVEGIVAHDIHGHGFFTEDGVELNNTFLNNIAFSIHRVHPDNERPGAAAFVVDETDRFFDRQDRSRTTSAFWIANAGNTYVGNVVAGSEGSGIWFAQPARPRGASSNFADYSNFRPRETPLGTFDHNTVHSSTTGFVVAIQGAGAENGEEGPFGENERMFGDIDPVYNNLTIYTTKIGLYPLVSNVRHIFKNFKAADNNFFSWDSDPNLIKDGLLVVRSRGNLNTTTEEVTGLALYHGNTIIEDSHIAGVDGRFFVAQGGGNRIRSGAEVGGLTYENDGSYIKMNSIQVQGFNNIRDVYDRDGTLTTPYGGGAGYSFIAANNWTFNPSLGDKKTDDTNQFKAMVSTQRFMNLETPTTSDPTLENSIPRMFFTSPQGVTKSFSTISSFNQRRISLRYENEYAVSFPDGFDPNTNNLVLSLHQWSMPSNSVGVVLKFVDQANNIKPQNDATRIDFARVNNISDLRAAKVDTYFTAGDNSLYIKLMNRGEGIHSNWASFTATTTTSCENGAETITEYFVDGTRVEGTDIATVRQGQRVTISGFPDTNTYTVTRPDGSVVNGDFTIDSYSSAMDGTYTITNQFGCSKELFIKQASTLLNHIAKGKRVSQSSTGFGGVPERAVDGNYNGVYNAGSTSHTLNEANPWWRVDLQDTYDITAINIYNRTDCCQDRISGISLYVGNTDSTDPADYTKIGDLDVLDINSFSNLNSQGRFVMLRHNGSGLVALAEVEVQGALPNQPPDLSFTAPTTGSVFQEGTDLFVSVDASDTDGTIASVSLSLDGQLVREIHTGSYEWGLPAQSDALLTNMAPGTYTLLAVATDNDGDMEQTTISISVEDTGSSDTDADGVLDAMDNCPNTPQGVSVNSEGCEIFSLPNNNFTILVRGESCRSSDNGQVILSAAMVMDYTATLSKDGNDVVKQFTNTTSFVNLTAGTYQLCFTVEGHSGYESCSQLVVVQPEELDVTTSRIGANRLRISLFGAEAYTVELNGEIYRTSENEIELDLNKGQNTLKVSTDLDCHGTYLETILLRGTSMVYPNPVTQGDMVNVLLDTQQQEVNAALYTSNGQRLFQKMIAVNAGNVQVYMDNLPNGIYMLLIKTEKNTFNHKIIIE